MSFSRHFVLSSLTCSSLSSFITFFPVVFHYGLPCRLTLRYSLSFFITFFPVVFHYILPCHLSLRSSLSFLVGHMFIFLITARFICNFGISTGPSICSGSWLDRKSIQYDFRCSTSDIQWNEVYDLFSTVRPQKDYKSKGHIHEISTNPCVTIE